MKKAAILVFLIILLISFPQSVSASDVFPHIQLSQTVALASDQVIEDDFFAAAESVEIAGTVDGDLYVLGGNVIIEGQVTGDLIAAAGQITVNGSVDNNLRLAGGSVIVNGTIGNNLTVAGGSITLNPQAKIGNNLVIVGGQANIQTPISGNLRVGAGSVTLSNQVEGDVDAAVGMLHLTTNAHVLGNLRYYSDQELLLTGDATVSGQIIQKIPQKVAIRDQAFKEQVHYALSRLATTARLISIFSAVIIGFLLIHFFPNCSYRVISTIEDQPGLSLVVGLTTIIVVPVLSIPLIISLVAIPVAVFILIAYYLLIFLSHIYFIYWLGARLIDRLGRQADKTITLLVGAGIYYVLAGFTVIGPIVVIIAHLFGVGALILASKNTYLSGRKLNIL